MRIVDPDVRKNVCLGVRLVMRSNGARWVACTPILVVLFGSCASSTTPPLVTPCDTAHVDLNGDLADGCEYACTRTSDVDPIDANYTDENCDGSDGDVRRCVFVASDGVDLQGGGTRGSPVKTIDYAIATAALEGKAVCVGSGVYTGSVRVASGVSIYGGFDTQNTVFRFRRAVGAVSEIQAEGTGVIAETITTSTELGWLKISVSAPDASGSSVYGVRLVSGTAALKLTAIDLQVAGGRAGALGAGAPRATDGTDGKDSSLVIIMTDAGSATAKTGAASTITKCGSAEIASTRSGVGGDGSDTGTGDSGGAAASGARGGSGGKGDLQCPGAAGGRGSDGAEGGSGTDGSGSRGGTYATDGQFVPGDGTTGTAGAPGGGGGGGGGGGADTMSTSCGGIGGASGGSGGCGANPGEGGKGGGACIGIVVASGNLIVDGGKITIGAAGAGGKGGTGISGGKGGTGGSVKTFINGAKGGSGGDGGNGGRSGGGGGGAGGDAACIAFHDETRLTVTTQPECVLSATQALGGEGSATTNGGSKGKSASTTAY